MIPIEKIPNLSTVSVKLLQAVGIATAEDLQKVGAIEAYIRLKEGGFNPSLNFLWAAFAGLEGMHWQEVTPEMKRQLKKTLKEEEEKRSVEWSR